MDLSGIRFGCLHVALIETSVLFVKMFCIMSRGTQNRSTRWMDGCLPHLCCSDTEKQSCLNWCSLNLVY